MKKNDIYIKLTDEDEISSIIYAIIATTDSVEKKQGNLNSYNPISFLINILFNEDLPVYKHLEFVTRKGGARYIINDVTTYRKIKEYKVENIKSLANLFKAFNCKTKEDIISLITTIYNKREQKIIEKNEIIKKVLMAYQTYYKEDISLSTWPSSKQIYSDFLAKIINENKKDNSFTDKAIGLGISSNIGGTAIIKKHLKYHGVKMIIIADGTGCIENENAAYLFCEYMNEWFWKSNPYSESFKEDLENAIKLINYQIGEKNKENNENTETSASVIIITKENYYICQIGTTRVYLVQNGLLIKIPHKESLYDDLTEKNKKIPFTIEYAKSIPYESIGHPISEKDKCHPSVIKILSPIIDGIIAVSYGIYQNTTDDEIETILEKCSVEDTAKVISLKSEFGIINNNKYKKLFNEKHANSSHVIAIYKKDKTKWKKRRNKSLTIK